MKRDESYTLRFSSVEDDIKITDNSTNFVTVRLKGEAKRPIRRGDYVKILGGTVFVSISFQLHV